MAGEASPPGPTIEPGSLAPTYDAFRVAFDEGLAEYRIILRREAWDEAWAVRERLAAQWRETAEINFLERIESRFLIPEGVELYSALESSLVLAATGADPEQEPLLTSEEVLTRALPVGASGFWGPWEEGLNDAWRRREAEAGRPLSDRPDDWPAIPPPPRRPRRDDKRTAAALDAELDTVVMPVQELYYAIDPPGHRATDAQRAAMGELLIAFARFDRRLDRATLAYSAKHWAAVLVILDFGRSLARSAALAISDDPDRRALAMAPQEVHARAYIAEQRLAGASLPDAFDAYADYEAGQR